jgi:membrane associated rhomboid family serine protease
MRVYTPDLPLHQNSTKILGIISSRFNVIQVVPYFTFISSGILILVHIANAYYYNFNFITGHYSSQNIIDTQLSQIYLNSTNTILNNNMYQFISYSILHYNLSHLIINIICYATPCIYLESLYTWKPITIILIISITAGCIVQCTYYKLSNAKSTAIIGISGGGYALWGLFYSHHVILGSHYINKLIIIMIFIIISIDYIYENNTATEIHLVGYIYGLCMIVFLLPYNLCKISKLLFYSMNINLNIFCFVICPLYLISL